MGRRIEFDHAERAVRLEDTAEPRCQDYRRHGEGKRERRRRRFMLIGYVWRYGEGTTAR